MRGFQEIYKWLGLYEQGTADLERAVAALRACEPTRENQVALAIALRALGIIATRVGLRYQVEGARRAIEESIAILERLGVEDELALSKVWSDMAFGYDPEGLLDTLQICRRAGCEYGVAWVCHLLGIGAIAQGAYDEAEGYLQQALHLLKRLGSERAARVVRHLGYLACVKGQHAKAKAFLEESLAALRGIGARGFAVYDLNWLGEVAVQAGDPAEARRRYGEALDVAQDLGDRSMMAIAITGLGDAARAEGDDEGAEAHYGRALAVSPLPNPNLRPHILLRQAQQVAEGGDAALAVELAAIALHRPLTDDETRARVRSLLDELRGQLTLEAYDAAVQRGAAQAVIVG
jgi:tetratricopeptide (TPR) repeat protein